jgi:hypothetical protein
MAMMKSVSTSQDFDVILVGCGTAVAAAAAGIV